MFHGEGLINTPVVPTGRLGNALSSSVFQVVHGTPSPIISPKDMS